MRGQSKEEQKKPAKQSKKKVSCVSADPKVFLLRCFGFPTKNERLKAEFSAFCFTSQGDCKLTRKTSEGRREGGS